jgi:hypothetical protein
MICKDSVTRTFASFLSFGICRCPARETLLDEVIRERKLVAWRPVIERTIIDTLVVTHLAVSKHAGGARCAFQVQVNSTVWAKWDRKDLCARHLDKRVTTDFSLHAKAR